MGKRRLALLSGDAAQRDTWCTASWKVAAAGLEVGEEKLG
jgi:hypothetical protein